MNISIKGGLTPLKPCTTESETASLQGGRTLLWPGLSLYDSPKCDSFCLQITFRDNIHFNGIFNTKIFQKENEQTKTHNTHTPPHIAPLKIDFDAICRNLLEGTVVSWPFIVT